jgi:SM-20-related protein
MSKLHLALRDDHDVEHYKARFAAQGYLRIDRLLPDATAEKIHTTLVKETPWHLVHATPDEAHKYYRPEDWRALPQTQRHQIFDQVAAQARSGFSYLYTCYPMIQAYLKGLDQDWPLHAMTEFLNTFEMLDFVKTITGEPNCNKLDCQATRYAKGHFLNTHYDTGNTNDRRVAYVMGFTKDWPANWGGQLLMLADDDSVQCGFTPTFNSLTLFKVPRRHIVTQVASFAGHGRYSITGWLLDNI